MEFVLDTHCHSLASGHAYSTIQEMAAYAKEIGFHLIAITDHGPKMPGGPHALHFRNLRVVPKEIGGVEILKGIEVNIMNHEGRLDVSEGVLKDLDIVIASLHQPCIKPGTVEENTNVLIHLMKLPYIHIIGHPGNPAYPIDIERFTNAAKEHEILIEINNSSLKPETFRVGSKENCYNILKACRDKGVSVVVGSDAHISYHIGNFSVAKEMIQDLNVPEELVMNTSVEKLKTYLKNRREKLS